MHLKDARRIPAGSEMPPVPEGAFRFSTEFEFLPLGKAVARRSELVDALRGVSYRGFLSMEYEGIAFGYQDNPWDVAAQTKHYLDGLLSV